MLCSLLWCMRDLVLQHPSLPKGNRACVYCDCIRQTCFVFVNSVACRDCLLHTSKCPSSASAVSNHSQMITCMYRPKTKLYLNEFLVQPLIMRSDCMCVSVNVVTQLFHQQCTLNNSSHSNIIIFFLFIQFRLALLALWQEHLYMQSKQGCMFFFSYCGNVSQYLHYVFSH